MNRTSFSPLLTVLRVTKYIQMPVTWAPFINTILKFFSLFFRLSPPIIHKRIQWKGIKGEFISSAPPSHKIILHIHGGGFLLGLNWIYRRFAKILSINTSLPVLLLDYHLLPKHPFPVALKETVNAYLALLKYGYLPQDIVLIGDSVGGNLLAAALLFLKARNYPLPAKAALLSPWLDLTLSWSASSDRAPLDPILSPALMPKLIRIYLKNRKISARHPLVSPLYGNLEGLPPLFISAGTNEVLFDEINQFAKKAKLSGVRVWFEIEEGMLHDGEVIYPEAGERQGVIKKLSEYIKETG